MDLQALSTLAGLLSLGFTIIAVVVGAVVLGRNTARQTASEAQKNAIDAMQAEINSLRHATDDLREENIRQKEETTRQKLIVETICAALKTEGMVITISGEMVHIQHGTTSTTTKIQGTLHTTP